MLALGSPLSSAAASGIAAHLTQLTLKLAQLKGGAPYERSVRVAGLFSLRSRPRPSAWPATMTVVAPAPLAPSAAPLARSRSSQLLGLFEDRLARNGKLGSYTLEEVARHDSKDDAWVAVDGKVRGGVGGGVDARPGAALRRHLPRKCLLNSLRCTSR